MSDNIEIEFIVGDVVRLKSGGPKMTVSSTFSLRCNCMWFSEIRAIGETYSFRLYQDEFPYMALEEVVD